MNTYDAPPYARLSDTELAPVIMIDDRGAVSGWSRDAERLLGYPAGDAVGRPAAELLVPDGTPPFWSLPAGQDGWSGKLSARRQDGGLLALRGLGYRFTDHSARGQWMLVAEAPGRFLPHEAERTMLNWLFTRCPVAVTLFDTELRCVRQNAAMSELTGVSETERRGKRLLEVVSGADLQAWEGRMRQVIETGEPAFGNGLHGRILTAPDHERVFSVTASALHDARGTVLGLCTTVADVTEQHRARERLTLLNEASTRIGSTLDVMQTAQELAAVAVPRLADWVTVDLLETMFTGDEPRPFAGVVVLRRVANQSILEGAPEAVHQPGDADYYPAHSPPVRCMVTGRSAVHRVTDPAMRAWLSDDPARERKFQEYGFQSIMSVPVRARGMTLGVTVFFRRTGEPFADDDRLLAEELVARAAVCLDNARRFTRERTAALTLQQSLLPQGVTSRTAIETASRYLPAGGQSGLGGDWFDVIPLSGARVALVVGDVVGHGLMAAATMGRLRTAVRTLADVDLPPDELLTHLDDVVIRLATEDTESTGDHAVLGATCIYAVYDPITRKCCLARAGHPPPAVVSPAGEVQLLALPAGPPLGLGDLPFESTEIELPEGSLLALYTDGLLGVRERDPDDALEWLCRALAEPAPSLGALCDQVLEASLPERPADDAALLIARTQALSRDQVAFLDVPVDPSTVATARSWATAQLAAWGLENASFITELVVSELVTNAIRYAAAPVQLRLIRDRTLICEVSDGSSTAPHMRRARLSDEGGRGLLLVAQLTQRWGTRHTREGKTIWCEQLIAEG
ncbi:SpoIIE family protein phosphatase [Streptomyces sp. NPDC058773]|uniref:SpoIIE family protein phosphatase n=1 Tax=Streptomyces sp. NPDC058773 TaxID=3346632 RepID=UPI0036C11779